jgi:hypothetical protein
MNALVPNDACFLCGGTATCRDSAVYLYCHDCESVSAISLPVGRPLGAPATDPSAGVDRWAGEGGAGFGVSS